MTTPDSFEYSDDSVVARVSVDIPNQAVNDIQQLTAAMAAMRTQLEAISRAQNDWLSYLQEMPTIVEQSNQALRNQITLMERMSYLQAEVGSSGARGGAGPAPGAQGGPDFTVSPDGSGTGRTVGGGMGGMLGAAAGGYSTAAPQGFRDDFAGLPGTGVRGGEPPAAGGGDVPTDPRVLANMAASRGMPINVAKLGTLGMMAASVLGMGNDREGSESPQKDNSKRRSGKPPNPDERGQSDDSEPQDEPGDTGGTGAPWQVLRDSIRENIKNNEGKTATSKEIRNAILMKGGSKLLGTGVGKVLAGGGLLAGGIVAAKQVQNIGEDITEYQQLGSVRGGGAMTGVGMELENRIRAMDPFVNLPQTREAMQAAYGNGFMGESVSEVQSQAIANFKELGMSMQETARMMAAAMYGKDRTDSAETLEQRTRLDATLRAMKDDSAAGGLSFPERRAALLSALTELVPMGMDEETVRLGQDQAQQAFGNVRGLGESIGGITKGVMNNPNALAIVGIRKGITGIVPEAMPAAFAEAGITDFDVTVELAKETAKNVEGLEPKTQRVGVFMQMMNQLGAELNYENALKLYDSVASGQDPAADARKALTDPKGREPSGWKAIKSVGRFIGSAVSAPIDIIKGINERFDEQSREIVGLPSRDQEARAEMYKPQGREPQQPPDEPITVNQSVNTEGTVTGNVTITVDQKGNVTAPPVIQLTGTQRSAQAGYSTAQVNNPSPGDPDYHHAAPPFGGR